VEGYPATSRTDNKTEICADCGTEEAMLDFQRHTGRQLRDELEVTGHVVMHKIMTKQEAATEMKKIMFDWEQRGWKKPNDVPESEPTKQRFRELAKAIGLQVAF
jgi:hypothetical protein